MADRVDGLGTFAEFEFKGEASSPEEAHAELTALIGSLGVSLGDRINLGYPHMILGRNK